MTKNLAAQIYFVEEHAFRSHKEKRLFDCESDENERPVLPKQISFSALDTIITSLEERYDQFRSCNNVLSFS